MMRNEISAETHLFMYVYAFLFYRLEGILAKLRKLKLWLKMCHKLNIFFHLFRLLLTHI